MGPGGVLLWLRLRRGQLGLGELWDELAELYGERTAYALEPSRTPGLLDADRLSFSEVASVVARLAAALAALGVRPGARVALCTENRLDYPLLVFAVLRLGATAVPLHHHLAPAEVERFMSRSGAEWLLADPGAAVGGGWQTLRADANGPLAEAFLRAGPAPVHPVDPSATAAILYTSGTSGTPKGAKLSHRALLGIARLAALAPDTSEELGVTGLPTAHVMGLSTLLCAALAGARLHWFSRFDAARVLDAIETLRATFFVGVPTMYALLDEAGAAKRDLTSVRLWASGADAMPPALLERFRALGCAVRSPLGEPLTSAMFAEVYGMVELSGPAIVKVSPALPDLDRYSPRTASIRRRVRARATAMAAKVAGAVDVSVEGWSSFGLPIPPYRVRVVDEHGVELPPGTVGELVIAGPGVTAGYDGDEAASRKVTRDGWLFTGDLASRSRLGRITFHARKKDVIKHGGFSVFPAELEAELCAHPAIAEAVVWGAPHATKGQVPVAAVVLRAGSEATAHELVAWCRGHMAPYRAVRALAVVASSSIPRNANGKVQKDRLDDAWGAELRRSFPDVFERPGG